MSRRVPGSVGNRLRILRHTPAGRRFQELRRQRADHPSAAGRVFSVAGGSALVLSGLITYPVPGPPSTLMILVGFTLIAQEWEWLARVLDGADLRLEPRRRRAIAAWKRLQLPTKILVVVSSLALLVALIYGGYRLLFGE